MVAFEPRHVSRHTKDGMALALHAMQLANQPFSAPFPRIPGTTSPAITVHRYRKNTQAAPF
jgi:hypothetical protein